MKKILIAVILIGIGGGAYAAEENSAAGQLAGSRAGIVVPAVSKAAAAENDGISKGISRLAAGQFPAAKDFDIYPEPYMPQACSVVIAYNGKPEETIALDRTAAAKNVESFEKSVGSLLITVQSKLSKGGYSYAVTVTDSEVGLAVTATANPLYITRPAYRALISCGRKN